MWITTVLESEDLSICSWATIDWILFTIADPVKRSLSR